MKKVKNIIKEIILAILIIFVISEVLSYLRKPNIGNTLPKMDDWVYMDNRRVELNLSRPTIIHFWATWCPTCRTEIPNIDAIKDDVNLITIAVRSMDLKEFMQKNSYEFNVIDDRNSKIANMFDIHTFPTTLIYDRTGNLKFSEVGYTTTAGLKGRLSIIN